MVILIGIWVFIWLILGSVLLFVVGCVVWIFREKNFRNILLNIYKNVDIYVYVVSYFLIVFFN